MLVVARSVGLWREGNNVERYEGITSTLFAYHLLNSLNLNLTKPTPTKSLTLNRSGAIYGLKTLLMLFPL